jgi:hypothetical protein
MANAFDAIPLRRLWTVCRLHFCDDFQKLIRAIVGSGKVRGVRQGSPCSPLFFNMFLDHYLDRPWARAHPTVPLFRYADNLLVPCKDEQQASMFAAHLTRLARSAGTPLKSDAIHIADLGAGQSAEWLGFSVSCDSGFRLRIQQSAWRRLEEGLKSAHLHPAAPIRANEICQGWLASRGAAYGDEVHRRVLVRLRTTAKALSFDEIATNHALKAIWQLGHARWCRRFQTSRRDLTARLRQWKRWATCKTGRMLGT